MAANRFNRCVGREIRSGRSFKQAVSSCKRGDSHRSRSGRRRSRRRR